MLINRLIDLDEIQTLEKKYADENNILVNNISTWKISKEYKEYMLDFFNTNSFHANWMDYMYSYNISQTIKEKVKNKLGCYNQNTIPYFTQNNTISIVYLCNLMKLNNKRNCILIPSYFSIENVFYALDSKVEKKKLQYNNGIYDIPSIESLLEFDVIWLTSPTFSTGVYFNDKTINKLEELLKKNIIIIADESFCNLGNELIRRFQSYENFIGIYSPHKAISMNGLKFSVILCNEKYEEPLEHWADVLGGNLSTSNIDAIYHFVSNNFDQCLEAFNLWISKTEDEICEIMSNYTNFVYAKNSKGCMRMIFAKNISYDNSYKKSFYIKLLNATNTMIYPGAINGFTEEYGFSFRINLLLYNDFFKYSFIRILNFLNSPI